MRGDLRLSAEARQAVWFLLRPPMPAWVSLATPARPAWVALVAMGAAMLPRWARRMYRLPGLPTTDIGASLAGLAVRTPLVAIPRTVREGPHQKAGRKRTEAAA